MKKDLVPDSFILQWTRSGSALDKINFVLKKIEELKTDYVLFLHDTEMLLPSLPFIDLTDDIYFFLKEDPINGERSKTFIARVSLMHPVRANLDYNPSPLDIDRLFVSALRKRAADQERQREIKIVELSESHIYFGMLMHFCGHRKVKPVCYSLAGPPATDKRPSVNIITPCHRPQFLSLLLPFVEDASMFWSVTWIIVYDKRRTPDEFDFSRIKPTIRIEQLFPGTREDGAADLDSMTYRLMNYALDFIQVAKT